MPRRDGFRGRRVQVQIHSLSLQPREHDARGTPCGRSFSASARHLMRIGVSADVRIIATKAKVLSFSRLAIDNVCGALFEGSFGETTNQYQARVL